MQITFSLEELRPLVEAIVTEMCDRFGSDMNRIAYTEPEAAALIGGRQSVLREARYRGEITGSKVGRGYVYTRSELLAFLERRKERSR